MANFSVFASGRKVKQEHLTQWTLKKALGVYVSPDRVRKIAFTDANVKRLWTQDGWKITRAKNLSDYLQTP